MVKVHSNIAVLCALVLMASFQASCQRAFPSKAIANGHLDNQMTDQELLKQIEAFASSDPITSSNAWKILKNLDQRLLIEDLKRLSSATSQDDFHRVMISFLFCYLDYEYQINRPIVLSGIQKGAPFKRPFGDWGASLVRRLMVKGDMNLLADLLKASKWSDGAMSAELSYAYSEALIKDPSIFLSELQNEGATVRKRIFRLLADNTLSAEDMMKVRSFLTSQCHDSNTHRLACEILRVLSHE